MSTRGHKAANSMRYSTVVGNAIKVLQGLLGLARAKQLARMQPGGDCTMLGLDRWPRTLKDDMAWHCHLGLSLLGINFIYLRVLVRNIGIITARSFIVSQAYAKHWGPSLGVAAIVRATAGRRGGICFVCNRSS